MRLKPRFVAAYLVCAWGSARAASPCEDELLPTENVVSYLETLLAENILEANDVEILKQGLERGTVVNPLAVEARSTAEKIHRHNLDHLLPLAEPTRIAAWAEATSERLRQTTHHRREVEAETRDLNLLLNFVTVRGGTTVMPSSFRGPDQPAHSEPVISQINDFEITQTFVTQAQWIKTMKSNPAPFQDRKNPDLEMPMSGVTWWSGAEFANRVSISQKLPPFYNFEGIRWMPGTNAEAGTLLPIDRYEELRAWRTLLVDAHHKPGYRFPFGREWFWAVAKGVAHRLGRRPEEITWKDIVAIDSEIAWFAKNSERIPHSTAGEEKFLYVDENRIFDILGNLRQFTTDMGKSNSIGGNSERFLDNLYLVSCSVLATGFGEYSFDLDGDHKYTGFFLARSLSPLEGQSP